MAANGKTIILTDKQLKRLQSVSDKDNIREFLRGKGIEHQSIYRPLETGRVSEKIYKRLVSGGVL